MRQGLKAEIDECLARLTRENAVNVDYCYWRIATFYDSLNQNDKARYYYREGAKAAHRWEKRPHYSSVMALADIFIKEKQFDSALFYFRNYFLKENRISMAHPIISRRDDATYRMMIAYDGLNQIDSAIDIFLPYAFMQWTNAEGTEFDTAHVFDNDYHCLLKGFLRIVSKKYSLECLKEDLRLFIKNIHLDSYGYRSKLFNKDLIVSERGEIFNHIKAELRHSLLFMLVFGNNLL